MRLYSNNAVELCGSWNSLSNPVLVQDMCTTACYRVLELDVSRIDSRACAKKKFVGLFSLRYVGPEQAPDPLFQNSEVESTGFRAVSYFTTDRAVRSFVTI